MISSTVSQHIEGLDSSSIVYCWLTPEEVGYSYVDKETEKKLIKVMDFLKRLTDRPSSYFHEENLVEMRDESGRTPLFSLILPPAEKKLYQLIYGYAGAGWILKERTKRIKALIKLGADVNATTTVDYIYGKSHHDNLIETRHIIHPHGATPLWRALVDCSLQFLPKHLNQTTKNLFYIEEIKFLLRNRAIIAPELPKNSEALFFLNQVKKEMAIEDQKLKLFVTFIRNVFKTYSNNFQNFEDNIGCLIGEYVWEDLSQYPTINNLPKKTRFSCCLL